MSSHCHILFGVVLATAHICQCANELCCLKLICLLENKLELACGILCGIFCLNNGLAMVTQRVCLCFRHALIGTGTTLDCVWCVYTS